MTRAEFMEKLERELRARKVPEPEDILAEYRRHFEYKLADGYSEEETAARLGDPAELAAQFEPGEAQETRRAGGFGRSALTWTGLVFADVFVLSFFAVFACWVLTVACTAVAAALVGLCLLVPFDMQPYVQLPEIPYWCGTLYALALFALAALAAAGCWYFARLLAQMWRSYFRFHRNAAASAAGKPVLPAVPFWPRLESTRRRRLRRVLIVSLAALVAFAAAAMVTSMLTAGALEYWHVWGWFV